MSYTCELKEQPAQPTLVIRTRTAIEEFSQVLGSIYGAIAQYLGEQGQAPAGPPFVAYHNMDMEDLDIEVGFPVARELPGRDEIQPGQIPGGKLAACLYTGSYEEMEKPYEALAQWIEEHDYEPTGISYEMYLNDPQETPPEALQTEILFPLK
jgi:effector-binding domain-containing protein